MTSKLTTHAPTPSPLSGVRWVWKDASVSPQEWRKFSSEVCSLLEERYQLYVQKLAGCTSKKERLEVESKIGFVQFKTNGLSVDLDLKNMHSEWVIPTLDGNPDFQTASVGRMDLTHPVYEQKVLQRPLFNILMMAKEKGELLQKGEIKRSEAFIRFQTVDFVLSVSEKDRPPSFGIEGYVWTAFKGNSHFLDRHLPGLRGDEMVLIPPYETSYGNMRYVEKLASMLAGSDLSSERRFPRGDKDDASDYVSNILALLGERYECMEMMEKEYLPFLVNTRQTLREVLERMVTEGHVDQMLAKKIKDEHPSFLDTILD